MAKNEGFVSFEEAYGTHTCSTLGVRSDKNRRNFEVFARNFSRMGHIWTQMLAEPSKFFGVTDASKASSCTV